MGEVHQAALAGRFHAHHAKVGDHLGTALAQPDKDNSQEIGRHAGMEAENGQADRLQNQGGDDHLLGAPLVDQDTAQEGGTEVADRTGGQHRAHDQVIPGEIADDLGHSGADDNGSGAEDDEVGEEN